MKIVDLTAGSRAIWVRKDRPDTVFLDIRAECCPTFVVDSTNTHLADEHFDLAVFDPPHVNFGKSARMSKNYGHHTTAEIKKLIEGVSREAHRITKPGALMAFKWNDHDQKLEAVLDLMPAWEPLFGHIVSKRKSTRANSTYWVLLRRKDKPGCEP